MPPTVFFAGDCLYIRCARTSGLVHRPPGFAFRMVSNLPFLFAEPFLSPWRHRQLFRRVLSRDIEATFRGSAFGLAWIVLIPLALVVIYSFVFGVILNAKWATPVQTPYDVPLIYFCGIMVFSFFMEPIIRATTFIREQRAYVTKIIFPVELLGWVLIGTSLFKFCVNLTLLLAAITVVHGAFPVHALMIPVLMLPLLLMTIGVVWFLAGIGAFVRDLAHALQALGPIIMFISPIFYSAAQIPAAYRSWFFANPLTFFLESMRGLLFFDTPFDWGSYLIYLGVALVVALSGFAFFQRLRPGFADVV